MDEFAKLIDLGVAGMLVFAFLSIARMYAPKLDKMADSLSSIAQTLEKLTGRISLAETAIENIQEDISDIKDDIAGIRSDAAAPHPKPRPNRTAGASQ